MQLHRLIYTITLLGSSLILSRCSSPKQKETNKDKIEISPLKNDPNSNKEEVQQEIIGPYSSILKELSPIANQEALLIGIEKEGKYKTLFIEYKDGKAERSLEIPALSVPQKDGFWFFQNASQEIIDYSNQEANDDGLPFTKFTYSNNHIFFNRDLSIVKDSVKNHIEKVEKGDKNQKIEREFHDNSMTTISYASAGYITFYEEGNGYTGGAHGFNYDNDFSILFSEIKDKKSLASYGKWATKTLNKQYIDHFFIKKIYSKEKLKQIERTLFFKGIEGRFIDRLDQTEINEIFDLDKYKGQKITDQDDPLHFIDLKQIDFIFHHHQGATKLKLQADASAAYAESGDYSLTTEYIDLAPLPNKIIPYNGTKIKFDELKKINEEIEDYYLSPKHNILFLKTKDNIIAVETSTGKQLIEIPIQGNIIMIEWAIGEYTEQWKDILSS